MQLMLESSRPRTRLSARLRGPFALAAAVLCCVLGTVGTGVASAAPLAPVGARPHASMHLKPLPVRPPASPNAVTGGKAVPRKPSRLTARPLDPAGGWTVTLAASSNNLWPTQYSTLTATANADVGPSPYYISIYDATTGAQVAICATGSMCTVSETESTASTQDYIAYVGNDTSLFPPSTIVATSNDQSVVWQAVTAGGTAFPTMDLPGEMITALGTASADVGPSPFYIEIFDVTTGTLVIACGSGQLCTDSSVSESSDTTQEYITVVAHYSSTFPPTGIQATSPLPSFVTWTDTGLTLSLNGESVVHGPQTYTATTNRNVGPTPYFIEIWDETTGALLAVCGSGTSCAVSFLPSSKGDYLIAFVASYSSTFPPANIQANAGPLITVFSPL